MSKVLKKRSNPLDNGILKTKKVKETASLKKKVDKIIRDIEEKKAIRILKEKVDKIIRDFQRSSILKMIKSLNMNKPKKLDSQSKTIQQIIKQFQELKAKKIKKVRFGKNVIFHFNH